MAKFSARKWSSGSTVSLPAREVDDSVVDTMLMNLAARPGFEIRELELEGIVVAALGLLTASGLVSNPDTLYIYRFKPVDESAEDCMPRLCDNLRRYAAADQ